MYENIFGKTAYAGMFGTIVAGSSVLGSEYLHGVLSNLLLIVGILSALLSIVYMVMINMHRNRIKVLDEARETLTLSREKIAFCKECHTLGRPVNCPIPIEDRPGNCPLNKPNQQRNL